MDIQPTSGAKSARTSWRKAFSTPVEITPRILTHHYAGSGTTDDPFRVDWLEDDVLDPLQFSLHRRWTICFAAGLSTSSVAYISSAYTGSIGEISADLGVDPKSSTLGLSLFLLGFVLGPFFWAPCSELFGRQPILLSTGLVHVALNVMIVSSPSLPVLLVLRLLSGAFGAATLTNSGGVIADVFPPQERGLAITVYASVPLFAPVLGPIVGAYVSATCGWRANMLSMALLSAATLAVAALAIPETYAPVLLERRAGNLARATGEAYVSAKPSSGRAAGLWASLATALSRPFLLAAHEPIISLFALYQSVVFGILYLTFTAFPIIYTEVLGWPKEQSGLSFLGILAGVMLSVPFSIRDNFRYVRKVQALDDQRAPPELRLPTCCVGGVSIVLGLLWCAWSASPGTHWLAVMASGVPFGLGVVLVTIGSTNYLVDSYTVYAASALTVCVCGRAVWGAVLPLFARDLFAALGFRWGLAIPAFLSFLCVPFPFVFSYYGPAVRARGRYAGQAGLEAPRVSRSTSESTPLLP